MKTFFNIEDIETVFLDAFDRGKKAGLFSNQTAESNWQEYKNSNHTVFQSQQSIKSDSPKPEDLKCPMCNGKMVSRKSQYGNFWGCAAYPKCKGTRDSEGLTKAEREANKSVEKTEENSKPAGEGQVKFRRS